MVQTVAIHGTNSGDIIDNTKQQQKYLISSTALTKYLISSTALVGLLRQFSAESFLLDLLQSSSLQDFVNSPLGSHVSSSVLWRERKIAWTDSGLPCSLDLLPDDRAPEAKRPPILVLPVFFLFLLHLILLAGVTLAAGAWLVLRELLDLKMEGKLPALFHPGNNFQSVKKKRKKEREKKQSHLLNGGLATETHSISSCSSAASFILKQF